MLGDGRAGHEGVTGGQIGRHVGRVVRGGVRPGSPACVGRVGWVVRVDLPGRVGRVPRSRKPGGRGPLAGTVRKWGGGVARSVGVGIVERASRAGVSRAGPGMELNGCCVM